MKWVFCLLFLSSPLLAADFPQGVALEFINDFSGGLNTASPAHKITNNFSPNMRNIFVHRELGRLKKRNGYLTVGSTSTLQKISFGFTYNHSDGSKEFLLSDSSVVLSTKDYFTYVVVSTSLNTSTQLECSQNGYKVYCTNGSDPVFTWDGTVKTSLDGTNGTPNVPKGKYITSFLNRVWVGNTAADPSSLDWSAVVSTAGTILTPDNFLAWPPLNHHSVGIGDGESLNALWVFRGQLQIGKDASIYTEYGDRDSNFLDRKTVSQAGVSSNDSVVNLDGVSYYKGIGGVYAYSGFQSQRISDLIKPDIDSMKDPTTRVVENSWETLTDFAKGQFTFGSTGTLDGFVVPSTISFYLNYSTYASPSLLPASGFLTIPSAGGSTSFGVRVPTETVQANFLGRVSIVPKDIEIWVNSSPSGDDYRVSADIQNLRTGQTITYGAIHTINSPSFQQIGLFSSDSNTQNVLFSADEINNSSFSIRMTVSGNANGNSLSIYPATGTGFADIFMVAATTVQYISEITTLTVVNAWSNFNSINNTNGGQVSYYFRTSTSVINITTQTWKTIIPGVVINAPLINRFVQWASTLTYVGPPLPNIDRVTIDHIEGLGSQNRTFATDWNNEYWLTVSTDLTSNLRLQYVKAWITNPTPTAWNVLSGINIGSIWKDGNTTLYGGSSSTGSVYRLDYGMDDDGRSIDGFYETPDLTLKGAFAGGLEGNWMEDQLQELWIDADAENGNVLMLGTAVNGGSFNYDFINLSGSSRILYILKNPNKFGKYFRFQFRNNQLDHSLDFDNFAILHVPLRTR